MSVAGDRISFVRAPHNDGSGGRLAQIRIPGNPALPLDTVLQRCIAFLCLLSTPLFANIIEEFRVQAKRPRVRIHVLARNVLLATAVGSANATTLRPDNLMRLLMTELYRSEK
jgi:hypothetical protein